MREYAFSGNINDLKIVDFDVVIAGSGIAGLYSALNLDSRLSCVVLNKLGEEESNSIYAQGGIASVQVEGDTWKSHFDDTLVAGAGICDKNAVEVLVKEGIEDIQKLIDFSVPFDKDENNNISVSMEGAHSFNRILHCGGDATGLHITKTLLNIVLQRQNITYLNNVTLIDILTDNNNDVIGIIGQDKSGKYIFFRSSNVIVASGGIGRIYRNSTNASCATGDGIAASIRAGAEVSNMEFVQFHPTALIHPDLNMRYFLISEALRGEGGVLRNRKWEAFMKPVHPMADLAPRDIVSRAIVSEMKKSDLPYVYLDITSKSREFLSKRFPIIYEECMKRGIDIAVNWIPVVPVQHYFMGGIKTDINGKTNINGLYACGESSCTGVHGGNRLASNSLLECLVFGRRCAIDINGLSVKKPNSLKPLDNKKSNEEFDFDTCRTKIRDTMTKKGGIIRNEKELSQAVVTIGDFNNKLKDIALNNRVGVETLNMSTVSLSILNAAIERKESLGAHYRNDDIQEEKV
jgi:L-aspartate oxidase